jgi:hypothetical protein
VPVGCQDQGTALWPLFARWGSTRMGLRWRHNANQQICWPNATLTPPGSPGLARCRQFALCRSCRQWASAQLGADVICRFPQEWMCEFAPASLARPGAPTSPPESAQLPLIPLWCAGGCVPNRVTSPSNIAQPTRLWPPTKPLDGTLASLLSFTAGLGARCHNYLINPRSLSPSPSRTSKFPTTTTTTVSTLGCVQTTRTAT